MFRAIVASVVVALCAVSPALAQTTFERKYAEDSKSITHSESKTSQILTLAGMDIETKSTQFVVVSTNIGKRLPDGTLKIESKIDTLQADLALPGGTSLAFDSGNPAKKADNVLLEPVLDAFRAAAKAHWITTLDKANQIKSLENKVNVVDTVDVQFKKDFDPEIRKKAAIQELAKFPDKPVKKGDTWDRTTEANIGSGQSLTFQTRYEYLGTVEKGGKTLDKIGVTATTVTYAVDPNVPSPAKVIESELKITSSEGQILWDRERGAAQETSSKARIQGTMKLSINGTELAGKLDLTLESKTTLQP